MELGFLLSGAADLPPEAWFWILLAAGSLGSAASFVWTFRSFRRARLIEDTPTAKVASAPQGYVELSGAGEALDGGLVCPLTGTPCLWYSYKVEVRRTDGAGRRRRTYWAVVERGSSKHAFWLSDGTGRCLVHPAGAEVHPGREETWHGTSPRPGPAPRRTGVFPGFFGGSFRYTESLLLPGQALYALGWFETLRAERRLEDELNERLRALKADRRALAARADRDGDGEVDLEEWDALRAAVREDLLRARAARPPEEACPTLTIPADPELPFIVGGRSQADLAARYRRRAAAGLALFLLLGAGAVATLNHRRLFSSAGRFSSR